MDIEGDEDVAMWSWCFGWVVFGSGLQSRHLEHLLYLYPFKVASIMTGVSC